MRAHEQINELVWGRGVPLHLIQFRVRDSETQKIVVAYKYDRSYLYVEDAQIPHHRIVDILVDGVVIWRKNDGVSSDEE